MKTCLHCKKNVKPKAIECPHCGNRKFEVEIIEPDVNISQPINQNNESNALNNQNTGIYSAKLESLIDLALSDGELTEKEKQVLFKKAELEGIDLDEFEMVLDAKLLNLLNKKPILSAISSASITESNNTLNTNRYVELEKLIDIALSDGILSETERDTLINKGLSSGIPQGEISMILDSKVTEMQKIIEQKAAPKSDKFGDVRKCPACGAIAETFATKCQDCGTEFRNIEASQNIIKFFEKLDEVESNRKESVYENTNSDSNIGIGTVIKWLFFWYILLPLKLFSFFTNKAKPAKWSTTDSRKEELIMNFPVPVSREEILEFLNLASSKINSNTYFNAFAEETKYKDAWNKIWLKKIEQIQSKASMAMKNDKKSLADVNLTTENARLTIKSNNKKVLHIALGFITLIAVLFIWVAVSRKAGDSDLNQQKELKTKAETFIKSGEYDKAEEIILSLKDESIIVEIKSKIQLEELTKEINALEIYLEKKEYSKLKFELDKIVWKKISTEYSAKSVERDIYKTFLQKKEAINNQLPEKFKVKVGSEYSL